VPNFNKIAEVFITEANLFINGTLEKYLTYKKEFSQYPIIMEKIQSSCSMPICEG
jgi:hypothetical protein